MLEKLFSLNQRSRKCTHKKYFYVYSTTAESFPFTLEFDLQHLKQNYIVFVVTWIGAVLAVHCAHFECMVKIDKPTYFKQFQGINLWSFENSHFFHTTPNTFEKYF